MLPLFRKPQLKQVEQKFLVDKLNYRFFNKNIFLFSVVQIKWHLIEGKFYFLLHSNKSPYHYIYKDGTLIRNQFECGRKLHQKIGLENL